MRAEPASSATAAQIQWRKAMPSAYQAARQRAAFLDRSSRGRLLVSGSDRTSYLQGLLTNDTAALKAVKEISVGAMPWGVSITTSP